MDLFIICSFLTIFMVSHPCPFSFSINFNDLVLYPVWQCPGHNSFLMVKMSLREDLDYEVTMSSANVLGNIEGRAAGSSCQLSQAVNTKQVPNPEFLQLASCI